MRCEDSVWLSANRKEASNWLERFPQIGNWLMTTIAESPRHAYLHGALSKMTSPSTGGLLRNLKRVQSTMALYYVEENFEVALCHRDPAFEDGPGRLLRLSNLFEAGQISIPPALTRLREIESTMTPVDIIVLPPSPLMSNQMRLQLATPALVNKRTFMDLDPPVAR